MNKRSISRDYVTVKFNELYMLKWKGQGKTAIEFVRAIQNVMPDAKCDYKYVSKWLNGYMSPVKYLPAICQVLDVDLSEFSPKTHDEKYQYSSDYADGLEGRLEELAEQNFKIDLTFFQGLRNIIPEFDSTFPVFCPLFRYGQFDTRHKPYQRSVPAEATETSSGQGLFQITKDGKTYFLTKYDMKMIARIQKAVRKIVLTWFDKLSDEMKEAETKANLKYQEENAVDIWSEYILSDEELQSIDRWGIYTVEEEQRFGLPRVGTPLYDDNTETEG